VRARLRSAEALLGRAEGALLVALLTAMVVLAFGQVVLRWFDKGLLWADILLKQLVMWTGFLGAALAAQSEKHFAWEAAHAGVPERARPWLRLLAQLSGAAVCALMFAAAWKYVGFDRESGDTLMRVAGVAVPTWAASAGIPAGFALIGTHFLFKAADAAAGLLGGRA
jgi:TRAP-type C4-dicarboxylate transport system permease small subunit